VFLGLHHGVESSNSLVMVHALRPRVAIMNNGTRKGGDPATMKTVRTSPGLEDLWQIHFSQLGGQEYTQPGMFIANLLDEPSMVMPIAPIPASQLGPNPPPAPGGILSASGYVTARRLATVSAEITGRVAEVLVEEGMTVQAGQVLARLDPTLAKIDLAIAQANVKSSQGALGAAESDRAEAQRILARINGLRRGDIASVADITKAEAAANAAGSRYSQAQGNLAAAQQSLLRAQAVLDKHEIRAPFTGVVTTRDAQPGEIVSPAAAGGGFTRTGIATIVDMDSREVEVDVNEAYINRVKPNQHVEATLDAYPDAPLAAHVIGIVPTADRTKATVRVRIGFDKLEPQILPEMGIKVRDAHQMIGTMSGRPSALSRCL
jgi:RND family efflux transporter MFP subunit